MNVMTVRMMQDKKKSRFKWHRNTRGWQSLAEMLKEKKIWGKKKYQLMLILSAHHYFRETGPFPKPDTLCFTIQQWKSHSGSAVTVKSMGSKGVPHYSAQLETEEYLMITFIFCPWRWPQLRQAKTMMANGMPLRFKHYVESPGMWSQSL